MLKLFKFLITTLANIPYGNDTKNDLINYQIIKIEFKNQDVKLTSRVITTFLEVKDLNPIRIKNKKLYYIKINKPPNHKFLEQQAKTYPKKEFLSLHLYYEIIILFIINFYHF